VATPSLIDALWLDDVGWEKNCRMTKDWLEEILFPDLDVDGKGDGHLEVLPWEGAFLFSFFGSSSSLPILATKLLVVAVGLVRDGRLRKCFALTWLFYHKKHIPLPYIIFSPPSHTLVHLCLFDDRFRNVSRTILHSPLLSSLILQHPT
jgi:hypothetical protein